jgi:multidrug efflux system outer membrane protein
MTLHTLRRKLFTPFVLILMLSGCAVGPDFKEPVAQVPDGYRTEGLPAAPAKDLKWWELFEDPKLSLLVKTALENNRDVQIAISRIEQARATVGFTQADQYPRVDVEAGARTGNFNGGSRSLNTTSTVYLAAPVNWEIDFWGKFKRSTAAARADLMASDYGLKVIQLTLITGVVSGYYQLRDFHRRLAISRDTYDSRLYSLKIIRQRFDKGIIGLLDVNQAQIQKEIAAASIPLYERSISITENYLSILLGRLPGAIDISNDPDNRKAPKVPVGLPSDILENRPDINQAMYLLKAQTERIGVAEALRFPSISLTGTLGVASTDLGAITTDGGVWSVGGRLLGPVIDFDKNKNRVLIEEQKTKQALYQYENTVLTAFREVEDALVEIDTYRRELTAIERQQAAAKSANELSKERYDKGVSSYLEVLETERSLFSAALRLSELKQQYFNAFVKLYKALGGGWIAEEEKTPDAQPGDAGNTPSS